VRSRRPYLPKDIERLQDIQPDPENPNLGTERGRYVLEQSMRRAGAGRSVLVDREGRLIAGNKATETWSEMHDADARVTVVQTQGDELVVVQRTDLDLVEDPDGVARFLSIADNRAAEVGLRWNLDQLAEADESVAVDSLFRADELVSKTTIAAPDEFPAYGDDIDVEHRCPKCGYEWSGSPGGTRG